MNMWHTFDLVLVTLLVTLCTIYVVYSLGSLRIKRRMLEWLIRCLGLRAYNLLSPKLGGCSGCSDGMPRHELPRKLRPGHPGVRSTPDAKRHSGQD